MRSLFLLFGCVAVLSAGCSKDDASKPAKDATPAKTPTAEEFLHKSAEAMLATKTVKFGLKRGGPPAVFDETLGLTFTDATAEYQAPDRAHATIKVGLKNGNQLQIERMWVPEGIYQTNPLTKRYSKAPPTVVFNMVTLFKSEGIPAVLQQGTRNPKMIGREKLDGEEVDHFQGEADGKIVAPLLADMVPKDQWFEVHIYTSPKDHYPKRLKMLLPDGGDFEINLFGLNEPLDLKSPVVAAAPEAPTAPAPPKP